MSNSGSASVTSATQGLAADASNNEAISFASEAANAKKSQAQARQSVSQGAAGTAATVLQAAAQNTLK
jgi:hypothetical protein